MSPGEEIAALLSELELEADPATLRKVRTLVALVLDAHGEGLARIVSTLEKGDTEPLPALIDDPLIEDLLLLHGLHPKAREQRITDALETARTDLGDLGADISLVSHDEDSLTVQLGEAAAAMPDRVADAVRRRIEHDAPDAGELTILDHAQPRRSLPLLSDRA